MSEIWIIVHICDTKSTSFSKALGPAEEVGSRIEKRRLPYKAVCIVLYTSSIIECLNPAARILNEYEYFDRLKLILVSLGECGVIIDTRFNYI